MDKNKKKWAKKHKKNSFHQAAKKDSSREAREAQEVSDKGFCVTDHAVYRYLQRVNKVDMDNLKDEIVPKDIKKQILFFKKGKFPVKGYKLIVEDKKVRTIYEA
jgi:hypothetical protein